MGKCLLRNRETPGVFGSFEWNDVEFFCWIIGITVLPIDSAKSEKQMFGDEQMEWLENALASSKASFKIIAGGNQMMNPIKPYEAFGNFPAEQNA